MSILVVVAPRSTLGVGVVNQKLRRYSESAGRTFAIFFCSLAARATRQTSFKQNSEATHVGRDRCCCVGAELLLVGRHDRRCGAANIPNEDLLQQDKSVYC